MRCLSHIPRCRRIGYTGVDAEGDQLTYDHPHMQISTLRIYPPLHGSFPQFPFRILPSTFRSSAFYQRIAKCQLNVPINLIKRLLISIAVQRHAMLCLVFTGNEFKTGCTVIYISISTTHMMSSCMDHRHKTCCLLCANVMQMLCLSG